MSGPPDARQRLAAILNFSGGRSSAFMLCARVSCQSAVRFTPFPPPPPSGHIPASRPSRSARRPARQPPNRVPRPT